MKNFAVLPAIPQNVLTITSERLQVGIDSPLVEDFDAGEFNIIYIMHFTGFIVLRAIPTELVENKKN